jgi:hypothetical protein
VQEAPVSCAGGEGNDPTGLLRAMVGFEPEGASPPPPMPSCWWEGAEQLLSQLEMTLSTLNFVSLRAGAQINIKMHVFFLLLLLLSVLYSVLYFSLSQTRQSE